MAHTRLQDIFIKGAIKPEFIAESIAKLQSKSGIGAHDIFLGQVRADLIKGREVVAIEYSAYEEMANRQFNEIVEASSEKFKLGYLQVYHSLGIVKMGEICLFVLASAPHRNVVFKAIQYTVEEIKNKVPVFGKELFEDDSYQWKVNS
ncbi:MAG: molybdenum cofactor biosynthesis protein MoaE [Flavobacteriaceae bacterium]